MRLSTKVPWLLVSTLALAGCDLGRYEKRSEEAARLITMKGTAISLPDKAGGQTGISLMLPRAVGDKPKTAAGLPVDGLVGMYEPEPTNGGGPTVIYGGVPAAEGPVEKVIGAVQGAMGAIAPGVNAVASDPRPNIKRLTFTGPQAFVIGGAPQMLPGKSDVLIVTSASHIALIVYRVSEANDTTKTFDAAIEASQNSIKGAAPLAAPADPAAPVPAPAPAPMP